MSSLQIHIFKEKNRGYALRVRVNFRGSVSGTARVGVRFELPSYLPLVDLVVDLELGSGFGSGSTRSRRTCVASQAGAGVTARRPAVLGHVKQ